MERGEDIGKIQSFKMPTQSEVLEKARANRRYKQKKGDLRK